MRRLLLPLPVVALLAAPATARADLSLRLAAFSGERAAAPAAHLVPPLALGSLALDAGSGAGGGAQPVLALVLGIFPGFGLGHYVAGAAWQSWALIDVLLLVAAVAVTAADLGVLEALAWIATVVERVVEGLDAYHSAGGGRIAARAPPAGALAAPGPPEPSRDGATDAGLARPPEVVLARF
ncbi:MAG TPA: hypothetical protein VF841_05160 [Anaeromyxobacter sp.]